LPWNDSDEGAWPGRNDNLRCPRMRTDPFPSVHRPLCAYVMTALVAPIFGHWVLSNMGFRSYCAGSTEYWFRPGNPDGAWLNRTSRRPYFVGKGKPLVFCHGIGLGPSMSLALLQVMVDNLGDSPLFLVDTRAVSMRFSEDVPCAREVAANIADMMQVWGFSRAHFVGHSFGSCLLSWVLRYQRGIVERVTFLDPVCFLLLKVLTDGREIQERRHDFRMDTMEMGFKYAVLTELFVCNFFCRLFQWEEASLDMQEFEGTDALIVLESEDLIVPTHSVQRLAVAEQMRRSRKTGLQPESTGIQVLWIEHQPHAGFLLDPSANAQVIGSVVAFHNKSK